jgi:GTP-binding protein
VRFVSALTGEGVVDLSHDIARLVASAPVPRMLPAPRVTRLAERPRGDLVVERVPAGYVVRGERVEHLVEHTNLDSETGLGRFQSQLDRLGVSAALEAAGVRPGDTVRIAGVEFEYQP